MSVGIEVGVMLAVKVIVGVSVMVVYRTSGGRKVPSSFRSSDPQAVPVIRVATSPTRTIVQRAVNIFADF